ncbi:probable peroxisomal acyl-coenzyme A oxidase 1 isoform X1 [Musca domestica]|uniref:Acyl-coenzyme A oxidase n=2 Tax=Musca domestica TaxID=7370 RepID=A0A1I8M970_MUSDO|nr:probable peroxisomal acyl-coenzyme A oxidase 1 isoform X1 [Musca domestica]
MRLTRLVFQLARRNASLIHRREMATSDRGSSIIPKTVNPDIQEERNAATFNVEDFALWWHGGEENLKRKRYVESSVFADIDENKTVASIQSLSHDEIYAAAMEDALALAGKLRKLQKELNPGGKDIWPGLFSGPELWGAMPGGNPFTVHFSMLVDAIRNQGTDEQFEKFGKRAENLEICAAFAQTELGHGTFLRGLQTRADFDSKTDEFVLNTPTITAYKFWPGGLGHSANYSLVMANLYIDNKPKGVAMFMVPIRDEETHMPLPGIDIGDVGKKLGFYGVNNGYLGMKNVRIPRTNMLMRHAQVEADGTFIQSPAAALGYFSMVFGRCWISANNTTMLAIAATIATRYSAVRRQGSINPKQPEVKIMDYVTQQMKLFPEIATCIADRLAALKLRQLYHQTERDIKKGKYDGLGEIHALSCAMKVMCTSDSAAGIERLRLACGGHGYLASSNLSNLYSTATAGCTYEGENTVLLLQVGRFLMKSAQQVMAGKPLAPTASYLAKIKMDQWSGSWENIVEALECATANKTHQALKNIAARMEAGQTQGEAANNTGIELTQAAELYGRSFIAANFLQEVTGINAKTRSPALNKVLENILELYLVKAALDNMNNIFRIVKITDEDVNSLQASLEKSLKSMRPNAVAICDGFDFPDRNLLSTLGCFDGNVYERIFEEAKNCSLNKEPVPRVFHTHLKPFMKSKM